MEIGQYDSHQVYKRHLAAIRRLYTALCLGAR
jgi:hypothetical protein